MRSSATTLRDRADGWLLTNTREAMIDQPAEHEPYAYVLNNPASMIDPSGLYTCPACTGTGPDICDLIPLFCYGGSEGGGGYGGGSGGGGRRGGGSNPANPGKPFVFSVTAYSTWLHTFQLQRTLLLTIPFDLLGNISGGIGAAPNNGTPSNPCSGASPGALDYSTTNAQQHILQNHTAGGKGPSIYSGDWVAIQALNGSTLSYGSLAPPAFQRSGTYALQWTSPGPGFPWNLIFTNNIGWGANGQPTPTNRLVVKTNCSTVITSYPVN